MERFKKLMAEFNIPLRNVTDEFPDHELLQGFVRLEIEANQNKGYNGFVCDFDFNLDGSFREVGVWE